MDDDERYCSDVGVGFGLEIMVYTIKSDFDENECYLHYSTSTSIFGYLKENGWFKKKYPRESSPKITTT